MDASSGKQLIASKKRDAFWVPCRKAKSEHLATERH